MRFVAVSEFYAALVSAIDQIDGGTSESRRAIYESVQAALMADLAACRPLRTPEQIDREQWALRTAIKQAESKYSELEAQLSIAQTVAAAA